MLTFLILLILAWSFYIGYARGIILQSYYFLVTLVALLIAGGRLQGAGQGVVSMGSIFESHPAISELFLCQPLPISIRWHLLCRFSLCIDFCDDLPDWSCDWDFYALGTPARKTGGSQISNWSGCDRRRDNSRGHPDGLDCPLNGSHGFHPK